MPYQFPFAYMSGDGLGVSHSSQARIGDLAESVRPLGQAGVQAYANIFNQNLIFFDRQIKLYEFGLPLNIYAVYNSLNRTNQNAWQLSTSKRMTVVPSYPDGAQAQLCEADGHITTYTKGSKQGNLCWLPESLGAGDPYLVRDETTSTWVIYYPGQELREIYNDQGQLTTIANAEGKALTYEYLPGGQLRTIRSQGGAYYLFDYAKQSDGGLVISISAADPEKNIDDKLLIQYCFDDLGRLKTSVAPSGYNTSYEYFEDTPFLRWVTQTDGTRILFAFDEDIPGGKLTRVSVGDMYQSIQKAGNTVTLERIGGASDLTVILDDAGLVQSVSETRGYNTSIPEIYQKSFEYEDDTKRLKSITHWDKGVTEFTYTGEDIVMLSTKTLPNGRVEQYYYDDELLRFMIAKVVTESDGKTYSHRFVYNYLTIGDDTKKILRFSISPMGTVTEHRYDVATGDKLNTRTYLDNRLDVSSMPSDASPSMEEMMSWLALQDRSNVRLITFVYDIHGQHKAIKKYVNVDVRGVGIDDAQTGIETTEYDEQHHLLSKDEQYTDDYAFHRSWLYDPLARLTEEDIVFNKTDHVITSHDFADVSAQVNTQYANNQTKQQTYTTYGTVFDTTHAGEVSQTQQTRESRGYYDPLQRMITNIQTDKKENYTFYDKQSNLGYTVSNTGRVKSVQLDLARRFTTIIDYANTISIDALFLNLPRTDPSILPQADTLQFLLEKQGPSTDDRESYKFHDAVGNLRYAVDAEGYLVEHRYNLRGMKLATIQYKTAVTADELTALKDGGALQRVLDPTTDRYTRRFYDDDGHLIAKQDKAGYITEYVRDTAGQVIEEILYATAASFTDDFPAVRPDANSDDAHDYYFRNNRGQIIAAVDPENFIRTFTYYANGLKSGERHFYTALDPSWDHTKMPALPAATTEDKTVSYGYDELKHCISRVDPYGISNAKKYDNMGNLLLDRDYDAAHISDPFDTTDIQLADPDKCRTHESQYDVWGQVIRGANKRVGQLISAIMTNARLTPEQKDEQIANLWAEQSSQFEFDESGLKLSATNTLGEKTQYFYDSERRLVLIVDPTGAATQHAYNAFNEKLSTCQLYQKVDLTQLPTDRSDGFITTDITKLLTTTAGKDIFDQYTYDVRGKVKTHTDPEGYVTIFNYNAWGEVSLKQIPVNNKQPDCALNYEYDQRGNWTSKVKTSNGNSITESRTFNTSHNKMDTSTDSENNTSKFTYDRRADLATITDAAQVVQHDRTCDAYHRVKTDKMPNGTETHDYDQRALTHTINHPQDGTKTVITGNVFGEKIKEQDAIGEKNGYAKTWTHDAGGQVATATDELGNVHQVDRNTEGQLNTRTFPKLSYDVNPRIDQSEYNQAGHLTQFTEDTKGLALKHQHTPNAFGFDEQFIDPKNIIHDNDFSRRGELEQVTHDVGTQANPGIRQTEAYTYNGQKKKESYTQGDVDTPNQYAVDFGIDGFDRSVSKTIDPADHLPENLPDDVTPLNIQEANLLNDNGHVIKHTDPRGGFYYMYYDARNKLRFKVNPDLSVFEIQYDQKGNTSFKRTYDQRIKSGALDETKSLSDVVTLMQSLASEQDTQTYHFYNANNQLQFTVSMVDGNGIIREHRYDAAIRDIGQIGYANAMPGDFSTLTTADLVAWVVNTDNHDPKDRSLQHVLDARGQKRFSFEPDGGVIESRFDAYGHLVMEIRYAAFVADPTPYLSQNPDDIKIPDNPAEPNHMTYHIYDVRNKPQFTIVGNAVIGYAHDENANLTQECHFNDAITVPDNYDDLVTFCRGLTPDRTKDKVKDFEFDPLNHVVKVTDPDGNVDIYQRDSLGNERVHIDRSKNTWTFDYDRAKRQVAKHYPPINVPTLEVNSDTQEITITGMETVSSIDTTGYDNANNVVKTVKNSGQPDAREADMQYSQMNHLGSLQISNVTVDDRTKPADMKDLPTKVVPMLSQNFVTNTKGKTVCLQSLSGAWEFKVYDAAERHVFNLKERDGKLYVTQYVRNVFGEQLQLIKYSNPLDIDFSQYTETGIPLSVVTDNLKPDPNNDEAKEFIRSQRGHIQDVFESPVLWHMPDADGAKVGIDKPHTQYRDDTRGKRILIRRQRFPGYPELDYIKRQWWDDQGNLLAEAESYLPTIVNGSYLSSPMGYKVCIYNYNAKKEIVSKTEWANAITEMPDENMSFETLVGLHQASDDDRIHKFDHNLSSRITKESLLNVTYHNLITNDGQPPSVEPQVVSEVSTEYGYSPVGLRTSEKSPSGAMIYTFYDARHNVLVKTGEPYVTQDADGNEITLTPLQFIYHNTHGQKVAEVMYAKGANSITDPTKLPTPLDADATIDAAHFLLYDNRGSVYREQDPNGTQTVKLYDVARNMSRHYTTLTNYVPTYDPANPSNLQDAEKKTHIDETQNDYDNAGNLSRQAKLRDSELILSATQTVNAFNALVASGDDDNQAATFVTYNRSGHSFATNRNKEGASVVEFADLLHQDTGYATSATTDLSVLSETDLLAILQDSAKCAELDINVHFTSQNGKLLREERPAVTCTDGDVAQTVQMSLSISLDAATKTLTISWPDLWDTQFDATLTLFPANDTTNGMSFTPMVSNGLSQVVITGSDLQKLPTDIYGYQLTYKSDVPEFEAVGQCMIDTGHDDGSKNLVVYVKGPAEIHLIGNTDNLDGFDLQDLSGQYIGHYLLIKSPDGRGYYLDVYDMSADNGETIPSGEYTVLGTRARQVGETATLPITLFTAAPPAADKPLPRTIGYSAELLTHDVLGELLIWDKLPEDYQKNDVSLVVNYIGIDDKSYTQTAQISPDTVLPDGHYVDPDGHIINANFKFDNSVKTMTDMTVSVILDSKNTLLQLYKSEKPVTNALSFESVHRNVRGIEHRTPLTSVLKTRSEEGDWGYVEINSQAGDPPPHPNPPPKPTPSPSVTTNQFSARQIAYITQLPDYDPSKYTLQYYDVTRAMEAAWVNVPVEFVNVDGIVISVMGIPDAAYQWRLSGKSDTPYPYLLETGLNVSSFLSDTSDQVRTKVVKSSITHKLDVWSNQVQTTDGVGAVTGRTFNKTNKLKHVDNPPAPVMDDDGNFSEDVKTARDHYYDILDKRIASQDERGKLRAFVRDDAGNEIKRILPDGVVARHILSYDGFEKTLRYADQQGKVWQNLRDQKHQVVAVITPMGRKTQFELNERSETLVETDPANNAVIYGYGIAKGWLTLKKMPSGQLQVMVHHRSGAIQSTTFAAASMPYPGGDKLGQLSVTHDMDFFGVILKTTLMDGTVVYYTLDKASGIGYAMDLQKHATRIVSRPNPDAKSPRQYRPLTTQHVTSGDTSGDIWQLGALVDVPNQDLEQQWSGGVLVRQIDHAENKDARFGFDGNLQRTLHDDQTVTGVTRKRSFLDPRGNIASMRDGTATFKAQRSATGLPRRQLGTMQAPDGTQFSLDVGNTYDDVDRPLIQGGVWNETTNAPELADGQGNEFGYDPKTGIHNKEHTLREGADITASIAVDDDMRVTTTDEADTAGKIKIHTERQYNTVAMSNYTETSTGATPYTLTRTLTEDDDQRVVEDITDYSAGGKPHQDAVTGMKVTDKSTGKVTISGGFNSQGAPTYEVTKNASTDSQGNRPATTTTTTNTYVAFEDQQLSSVGAHTDGPGGGQDIAPASQYYDASRTMVSRTNVDTGYSGETSMDEVYDTNTDGTMMRTAGFQNAKGATPADLFKSGHLKENFHDPDDNLVASYQKPRDPRLGVDDLAGTPSTAAPQMHLHERAQVLPLHGGAKTLVRGNATSKALSQAPAAPKTTGFQLVEQDPAVLDQPTPETPADFKSETGQSSDDYRSYIPQPVSSFPPATQAVYKPLQPMTAAQISKQMFGSDAQAGMIAQANGGKPLDFLYPADFNVTIPDLQILTFENDRSLVISRIMAIFEGSLQPHISFAPIHQKKKKHCLDKVMHILIQVLSAIAAIPFKECPPLAALVAALTDMELQGLAKACHLIQHFSWAEVMDSAISGYLSAKLPVVTGAGSSATGAATGVAVHQTAYLSFASLTTAISHLTFDSVMELAAEQATINITTQLANIAMGFQKDFDVRSVFDTMAVAVFDAGIQQVVKLPSQDACLQDFGKNLFAATAKGIENIAESYIADAITGTPHHLDDLLESALGTTTGSVLSTYMPVLNLDGKKGQSANHAQQSQRPKMTHASNMPDDHNHGADPSYKVAIYTAHGGTSGDLSLPPIPGGNQLAQANALSNLDSNTNRPASSTNNPYGNASGYTKADNYQQALHTAAVGLHTLDTMMHNGMHLLYEAAQQQAAAQPTQTSNALHGGAPGSRVGQGSAAAINIKAYHQFMIGLKGGAYGALEAGLMGMSLMSSLGGQAAPIHESTSMQAFMGVAKGVVAVGSDIKHTGEGAASLLKEVGYDTIHPSHSVTDFEKITAGAAGLGVKAYDLARHPSVLWNDAKAGAHSFMQESLTDKVAAITHLGIWGGVSVLSGGAADEAEVGGLAAEDGEYAAQYRAARMLGQNVGYNVSPEAWFNKFDNIGNLDTYVTDYRAVGEVLGPVRANTKFEVGLFSRGNKLSYFKVRQLENALGLSSKSLTDGFRFSRVPSLFERSVRSPLGGNDFFVGGGAGLPGGGPELTIDPVPTSPWPPRRVGS